jgi:hypothetical protein
MMKIFLSFRKDWVAIGGKAVIRKQESRSFKLLLSPTAWMPASEGMTNYDTVSQGDWIAQFPGKRMKVK